MTRWVMKYPPIGEPHVAEVIMNALNQGADILVEHITMILAPHFRHNDATSLMVSWGVEDSTGEGMPAVVFSEHPAAKALEEGTGVYGPKGTRIYPKTAKALAFEIPGQYRIAIGGQVRGGGQSEFGEKTLFFKSVKGQRGIRYVEKAVASSSVDISILLGKAIEESIVAAIENRGFVLSPRTGRRFFGVRGRNPKNRGQFSRIPRLR